MKKIGFIDLIFITCVICAALTQQWGMIVLIVGLYISLGILLVVSAIWYLVHLSTKTDYWLIGHLHTKHKRRLIQAARDLRGYTGDTRILKAINILRNLKK